MTWKVMNVSSLDWVHYTNEITYDQLMYAIRHPSWLLQPSTAGEITPTRHGLCWRESNGPLVMNVLADERGTHMTVRVGTQDHSTRSECSSLPLQISARAE